MSVAQTLLSARAGKSACATLSAQKGADVRGQRGVLVTTSTRTGRRTGVVVSEDGEAFGLISGGCVESHWPNDPRHSHALTPSHPSTSFSERADVIHEVLRLVHVGSNSGRSFRR